MEISTTNSICIREAPYVITCHTHNGKITETTLRNNDKPQHILFFNIKDIWVLKEMLEKLESQCPQ